MAVRKITKRWLYNSFLVILIILTALIIGFSIGIRSFYYSSAAQIVTSRATSNNTLLLTHAQDKTADFMTEVRKMVENFDAKSKMEMMAINASGKVIITSSGFEPSEELYMPDFYEALSSTNLTAEYRGYVSGENILAVTMVSPVSSTELAAFRYVVSLTEIDKQIIVFIAVIALIGMAIIFFVIMSSSYFINSIVIPVGEIGKTARKIAGGNFSVRLKKENDDEVGELCDIINYMAEELHTADKVKNDFISSVSHELRTPLTAIKGWGETMRDQSNDTAIVEKGMNVILSETDRLSHMVEELLDFSRIQSGRFKLAFDRIDIIAELSDVVLMFTERAKREGMKLIYEEIADIVVVVGDRNRLRQVFVNIIDNALKYSDAGDTIIVDACVNEPNFVVTIADTGSGISAEDLPKIKNKFYKGNSTRRGSGIGLAVADEIVRMHLGALAIDSVKDEGTTVNITLPLMTKVIEQTLLQMAKESQESQVIAGETGKGEQTDNDIEPTA